MASSKPTIVVFGCTGTIGKEVMRQLNLHSCLIRGVLRSPERAYPVELSSQAKVTYLSVDLGSEAQLKRACMSADAVFLLTATSPRQVIDEINIINAANAAGVGRIVKLSAPVVRPPVQVEVSDWHRSIEAHLMQTGIDYCCLRPYAFMQNWERNTFTIQRFGKFFGSLGKAARNYIDGRDVAEIAVHYLLCCQKLGKLSITLAGPEAITNQDMAARLSYVTSNRIDYIDISAEELSHRLMNQAKLPKWLAHHIVQLDKFAIEIPEPQTENVEPILHRKPRIMDAYLQETRHLFSRKPLWKFWN